MAKAFTAHHVDAVIPLFDELYHAFLRRSIAAAKLRIWASIFIVNPGIGQDLEERVRSLVQALGAKRHMGLDVRIVLGASKTNQDIQGANLVALRYLRSCGVPAKLYRAAKSSTHAKYVLIDEDLAVVGSHNWSHNAFSASAEDSLAIRSRDHVEALAREFLKVWVD